MITSGQIVVYGALGLGIGGMLSLAAVVITIVACAPRAWRDVAPLLRRAWIVLRELRRPLHDCTTVPILRGRR